MPAEPHYETSSTPNTSASPQPDKENALVPSSQAESPFPLQEHSSSTHPPTPLPPNNSPRHVKLDYLELKGADLARVEANLNLETLERFRMATRQNVMIYAEKTGYLLFETLVLLLAAFALLLHYGRKTGKAAFEFFIFLIAIVTVAIYWFHRNAVRDGLFRRWPLLGML